ncbi:MAG: toprim domain-containing protein, partial [Actinomycetota bacterium]
MAKSLVIVESPAKARTIAGYLGGDYAVESSIGHVRDLPDRASDIPKEKRKQYGSLGVDIEHAFEPYYVVDPNKKKVVSELKSRLKGADELILATDEDREGESIGWHLFEVLKPKVPVRRMVFHEITREAIQKALNETRSIDLDLVHAQETRRILDRLVGYTVSPLLWKKIAPKLSAGRV